MSVHSTHGLAKGISKVVTLAHGGGGRQMHELIKLVFLPAFANEMLSPLSDSAIGNFDGYKIAITTDAFVVSPIEFPGGDIGKLSVCGTVNDLSVAGARPIWLCASFIVEEGLPIETLERIANSMRHAAIEAGVSIVAGDTKVVGKGACDKLFIVTSGVGVVQADLNAKHIREGDVVIVNGYVGDHGIAVMSKREGLGFETEVESDCAPLWSLVESLLYGCKTLRCLKDPTRGGLATALHELAEAASVCIEIDEDAIPIRPSVLTACELLGIDPLYVANEGKLVAIVSRDEAEVALSIMRSHPLGKHASIIGRVIAEPKGQLVIRTTIGSRRLVEPFSGEQLPRIC
ncbi:MAG: hydrogenase expression/formation protein HypE [Armatimonadota bacterium]|nr:hydrogenase expression/formation protein HypE [Armatimonadota bacterium]MCX7778285.1 hydrogenase expression/formation protein HypE [Armatimonadota bacterium]MDW8026436.1 hydrogenase expression/formation protein HypE [Armatimonadota bacterium]